jgi:LmbE family N-acetylglucosaminyl deacetylase
LVIILHVSPHPDDEALGAPATLLLLRRAGGHVVNAVVSLGRPADQDRRRREALDASARAGFELALADQPFAISSDDDLTAIEPLVIGWVTALLRAHRPAVVVSPSPDDVHPGHELVARATRRALETVDVPPPWWMWGLWADLPRPTLYVPFDDDLLAEAQHVLGAYEGELQRNDYHRLLSARASAHAVLGSERVFGFGSARASTLPYAELLTELNLAEGRWCPGPARVLDAGHPLLAR